MPQNGGRVGSRFGPYELRSLIGRGGMGEVYEAHDTVKDRTVALKLLPESLAGDDDFRERFRREARTAARLQEPHVIPIHDFGEIDGVLFIDMRLVRGEDLKTIIRRGPLGTARSLAIVSQVASALDAAHGDGLVHRDIKPENVMVTPDDFAYLADFGIAATEHDTRLTGTGSAIGSIAYMAPERFQEGAISGSADIYSLGCVLYECLTGHTPYRNKTVSAQIAAHLYESPPPVQGDSGTAQPQLDAVIATALAKSPEQRYRTAGEFAAAARAAVSDQDQDAATTIIRQSGGSVLPPMDSRATQAAPMPQTAGWGAQVPVAQQPTGAYYHPAGATGAVAAEPSGNGVQRAWWVAAACAAVAAIVIGFLLFRQLTDDSSKGAAATSNGAGLTAVSDPSGSGEENTPAPSTTEDEQSPSTSDEPESSEPSSTSSEEPETSSEETSEPSEESSTSSDEGLSGPGYGRQGWNHSSKAHCNADDPADMVARTPKSYVVICARSDNGARYYRAYRTTDGSAIEIAHPTRTANGWHVTNKGTNYYITRSSLRIVSPSGKELADENVQTYDETS